MTEQYLKNKPDVETHSKKLTREIQGQGLKFILSHNKKILKSYQAIHFLGVEGP